MQQTPFVVANFAFLQKELAAGAVGIFPSDTSYGFSALPLLSGVVEKIQKYKQRVAEKPFLLLVANAEMARDYGNFSEEAWNFARARWLGKIPTTILVPKQKVLRDFFPNAPKVALRVPCTPLLREFLRELNSPLISTSANISGAEPIFTERGIRNIFGAVPILFANAGDLPEVAPSEIWEATKEGILRRR